MLTKYIPQNIQEKLKAKERALERAKKPDEPQEGYMSFKSMASRTIFVRMCSNKVTSTDNKMIDGGFNNDLERKPFGFSSIYRKSELANGDKFGRRPVAGIKSIEVQYKGGFKAIRECTVSWVVPSLDDLEMFHDHFFTLGKTVIVDWGWIYSDDNVDAQLANSFISRVTNPDGSVPRYEVNQEIFTNPQRIISTMDGDYDAIGGQVTNFESSLRPDGGFDCTTKIISMGASLFKRPLDVGGNQAGIKLRGKDAETTPPDSLINCILNLRYIIYQNSFKIPLNNKENPNAVIRDLKNVPFRTKGQTTYGFETGTNNIVRTDAKAEPRYAIEVDDKDNPQVLWTILGEREDFFVTWGWFEDNIINRYASFVGGTDKEVKLTMRSLDTVLDEFGNPVSSQEAEFGFLDFDEEDRLNINTDDDVEMGSFDKSLKTPVLIRKPKFLLPVNPRKFFTSGFSDTYANNISGWTNVEKFYKIFFKVGDEPNFRKFAENEDDRFGVLRNIWINIKEIQTAFGIKNADSNDTSTNNINPPGTLDVGINNLLTALNTNFHNIWDFEVISDPYNPTNIKVVDKSDSQIENPQYTQYLENSHRVQSNGVFQFPSFKRGSMVKNQTLNFKIPDAQALTILYGSNKKDTDEDQDFVNGQLQKLFEIKRDRKEDAFLSNLESSKYSSKSSTTLNTNVGSYKTKPNSKIGIGENYGLNIDVEASKKWWRIWNPDIEPEEEETNKGWWAKLKGVIQGKTGYYEIIHEKGNPKITYIENGEDVGISAFYIVKDGKGNEDPIMVSGVQRVLNSYLNASSPVSQFDMSNLVPAELGLEIDGTGGITPFDIIHTEYIQSVYKSDIKVENFVLSDESVRAQNQNRAFAAGFSQEEINSLDYSGPNLSERTGDQLATEETSIGPLTFFQITDVKHTLDESGWKTELTSKMRINRIQRADKIKGLDLNTPNKKIPLVTTQTTHSDITGSNYVPSEPEIGIVQYYTGETPEVEERVVDTPQVAVIEQQIKKVKETIPDDVFVAPGTINSGGNPPNEIVNAEPDLNKNVLDNLEKAGTDVVNADGTPYDTDITPEQAYERLKSGKAKSLNEELFLALVLENSIKEKPPIKPSAPLAKAYDRKLGLRKMPYTGLPIPEKVEQIEVAQTKSVNIVHKTPELTFETGENTVEKAVEEVVEVTYNYEEPVEATIEATEPIKQEKLSESIVVETPVVEPLIVLKSTYDPSIGSPKHPDEALRDYKLNPTFQLIYKIVPNWYTKSGHTKANSIYGEDKEDIVLLRYRQKFWDEVIEAPNETGKTAIRSKADINAKLAEIGEKYKNLGPYDTWAITTGIPYAMYNPATGKADYTEKGVKIVLPKGPGAN